jgi:hypothetical protein
MNMHTPQNTECFNWQLWMKTLYVRTIAGVHEHLWYITAITKTQVSERRHMGSSNSVSTKYRHRLLYLERGGLYIPGLLLPLYPLLCTIYISVKFWEKIQFVFRRLYIAECGMLFWKAQKLSSNFVTICYRICNVYVHLKHFLHVLR